jgi:uncharacterized membrane protein (UPF0127 family)
MGEHWHIALNGEPLRVQVLRTPKEHAKGYQNHKTGPGPHSGLLFLWPDEKQRAFHMRNVPCDLGLLGFNTDGELVCSFKMEQGTKKVYSTPPCKFVLECDPDWVDTIDRDDCRLQIIRE